MTVMPPTRGPARASARGRATLTAAALSCAALALAACTSATSSSGPDSPASTGTGARQAATASAAAGLAAVHGLRRLDAVRQPGRAAELRRPVGPEDHPGAVHGPGERAGRQAPGRPAGQPRRPGGAGRYLAAAVAFGLDQNVASEYNIIGFDPRGVGASVPALHCDPSFFAGVRPDYIPANKAAEQTLIGRARAYAADCERRFGWLLPYMTTEDVARDMDSIRAALGQQQDQLPGLLLRHLPGPGLRHAVRQQGQADGA